MTRVLGAQALVQLEEMAEKLVSMLNLVVVAAELVHIHMALLHHLREAVRYLAQEEEAAAEQRHQPQALLEARGVAMPLGAVEPLVQVGLAQGQEEMAMTMLLAVVTEGAAEDITEPVETVGFLAAGAAEAAAEILAVLVGKAQLVSLGFGRIR